MHHAHAWIACLIALSAPGNAAFAKPYPDPVHLGRDAIDVSLAIAPSPAPGSAADRADFGKILGYQRSRSDLDCARAARVVDVSLLTLFGPKDGPLSDGEARRWSAFFEKIRIDADYFVQETKLRWGRPRPYLANDAVRPCVHRETTKAYPSGHAAISRVFARVLAELDLPRKGAFDQRADRIAEDRVLAGVHHPTDIEAGKKLGDLIFEKLVADAGFMRELGELKASPR